MPLYGRQGRIVAKAGQRDALVEILSAGAAAEEMPGCRLYVIGLAETDEDTILITEIWDSEQAHRASLDLASVKNAISEAMTSCFRCSMKVAKSFCIVSFMA